MQKIVLITGAVTSGKTTFLASLAELISSRWQVDGFLAKAPERIYRSAHFSQGYVLYCLGNGKTYPWAIPLKNNSGYLFDKDTQSFLDHRFARQAAANGPDILVLDELGKLELKGAGLEKVLQSAISSNINRLVCTVKKRVFNEIVEKYDLQTSMCIDLDGTDSGQAIEKILPYLNFHR